MVVGGSRNRVAQAIVCVLALAGATACTGTGEQGVTLPNRAFAVSEALKTQAVLNDPKNSRVQGEQEGHAASRMISASEYSTVTQMHSPHGYPETMEDFFESLDWYLETRGESLYTESSEAGQNSGEEASALWEEEYQNTMEAVRGLLGMQGEFYFGAYREEEISVVSNRVYDDIRGDEYRQYVFFLPGQPQPEAQIYISANGSIYGGKEGCFWSNDSQAAQMPGFHSCVEEGKRRILDYLEIASPGCTYEIAYKGLERKDELEQYMQALHYFVREKTADGESRTWEAYVEKGLNHGYNDCYYAELEENSYEKRQLCTWKSEDGHFYSFAFSIAFQTEEDGGWRSQGGWNAAMLKDGISWEPFYLDTESYDWHEEMVVDDYNFDNIPDVANVWGMPANWGGRSTTIYVKGEEGEYHNAGTFPDIPDRAADIRTLYDFSRGGYGHYFQHAYQYRDGRFECIGSLEEKFTDDDSVVYTVRDEAGNEEVYRDELPEKWKDLWY